MVLVINDPYGGGQEEVRLGSSRITPRETYAANPAAIQSQYRDRMSQVSQLTEALSNFGRSVGSVEKAQRELELQQTEVIAAQVLGQLNSTDPVQNQISSLRPDLNPLLRAAVTEAIGRRQGETAAQSFIESLDPSITNDPARTQQAFQQKLAEEANRVGSQHFYGSPYIGEMRKAFDRRSGQLSSERTQAMRSILLSQYDRDLYEGGKEALSGRATPQANVPVEDQFSSPDVKINYSIDPQAIHGRSATENAKPFSNIVIHHAVGTTQNLVRYGQRTDQARGGAFGYHFYIDPDGTIVQGAPMSKRTNHVKPDNAPQRIRGFEGVENTNSIGITLVNAHENHTPAQEEALKKLTAALSGSYGIGRDRIFGHGELQSDRMSTEGKLARIIRESASTSASPTATPAPSNTNSFRTTVAEAARKAGVPEELVPFAVAQASLESNDGKSNIAQRGNNLFGIKAATGWTGGRVDSQTTEVVNGQQVRQQASFRSYASMEDSVRDWWSKIKQDYPTTASAKTVEEAVSGLYQGRLGNYATLPQDQYLKRIQSRVGTITPAAQTATPQQSQAAPTPPAQNVLTGTPSITPPDPSVFVPPASGAQEAPLREDVARLRAHFVAQDARLQRVGANAINKVELKERMIEQAVRLAREANNGFGDIEILRAVPTQLLDPKDREKLETAQKSIFAYQRDQINFAYTEKQRAQTEAKRQTETYLNSVFMRGETLSAEKRMEINSLFPDLLLSLASREESVRNGMINPQESSINASKLKSQMTAAFLQGGDPDMFRERNRGMFNMLTGKDFEEVMTHADNLRKSEQEVFNQVYKEMTQTFLISNFGVSPEGLTTSNPVSNPLNPTASKAKDQLLLNLVSQIGEFAQTTGKPPSTVQERIMIFNKARELTLQQVPSTDPRVTGGNQVDPNAAKFQRFFGR